MLRQHLPQFLPAMRGHVQLLVLFVHSVIEPAAARTQSRATNVVDEATTNVVAGSSAQVTTRRPTFHHGTGRYNLTNPDGVLRPSNGSAPRTWAQNGQDLYLDSIFRGRHGGVFMEIGGFDGETFSNTLFFERERGWGGLLIEANPIAFSQIVQRDRQCLAVHACIGDAPNITLHLAGGRTTSSEVLSRDQARRMHRDAFRAVPKHDGSGKTPLRDTRSWEGYGTKHVVSCYPVKLLLHWAEISRIDLLSVDMEGSEMILLRQFPWGAVPVETVLIEAQYKAAEIEAVMVSHGYCQVGQVGQDAVYSRRA